MGAPLKWLVVVLAGLGSGMAGRLWSDTWRSPARTGGADAGGFVERRTGVAAAAARSPGETESTTQGDSSVALETVDGILASEGFERAERVGRFLTTAQPSDLERLFLGLRDERGSWDSTLADAIFLRWMSLDAAGGLAFAEKHGFANPAWWAWGKTDPDAALAAALKRPGNVLGSMVVRAIAQTDPIRAREILDEHPRFQEASSMGGLATGLMKVDPAAGATLSAAWNYSLDHENLISGWARREPEAALAWAQSLPDLTKRAEALSVVIDQMAEVHPDQIGPTLQALPEGRLKWQLFSEHAKRLAATDLNAARAWVEAAPTPLLRRQATVELARGLTASDPAAALEAMRGLDWLGEKDSPIRLRSIRPNSETIFGEDPLTGVVVGISAVAPAESLAFIADLSAFPHQKSHLTREAFQSWVTADALAASEWLANQPVGVVRQSATEQLALHLSRGAAPDFEAAAQWALTLPRENGISGVVRRVFQEWRGRDREASQAFLDHPDCPPEVRAAMAAERQAQ